MLSHVPLRHIILKYRVNLVPISVFTYQLKRTHWSGTGYQTCLGYTVSFFSGVLGIRWKYVVASPFVTSF